LKVAKIDDESNISVMHCPARGGITIAR